MSLGEVRQHDLTYLETRLKSELRCEFREEQREVQAEVRTLREKLEQFQFYVLLGVMVAVPFLMILIDAAARPK